MRFSIDDEAKQEAREQVAWYASRDKNSAKRLAALFVATAERIARNPLQFPLLESIDNPGDIRRARLADFPIVVIYQLLDDEARVVAVAHTSREPSYLKARLRRTKPPAAN
jgi:toxin ParE1/3/4